ncbi:transposase [Jeongeupella avenae]|uniref:Transposase n=1 Tax=Antarcticirhabdus aurantiaca TaxID=2606717 RepID=A0ACD4NM36_9HYPH|nr:transposase [Antarcticirhabdus aurantiaca]WAJ27879.1 transposase [Jeongeuplla avenae]
MWTYIFDTDPGAHAVLILDRAGWHRTPKLVVPASITLLFLPPRAPDLKPVENVWHFPRDNWLFSRIFANYDDIVAHCCHAWNKLVDQPWKIISIGMSDRAHRQ